MCRVRSAVDSGVLSKSMAASLRVPAGRAKERLETESRSVQEEVAESGEQGLLYPDPPARLEFLRWDEAFSVWWNLYPKKAERSKCRKKWRNMWSDGSLPPLRALIDDLERHKLSKQWQEHRFIPNPHTWLHGERWEDEIEPNNPYGHERDEHARQILIDADVSIASGAGPDAEEAKKRLRAYGMWTAWRKR